MATYADEIEEASDNAARRARANALFGDTGMAARLSGGAAAPNTSSPPVVVDFTSVDRG